MIKKRGLTRWEEFHTPRYVRIAMRLRAYAQSFDNGIIYATQLEVAGVIAESWDLTANAFRLTYTREFYIEYGWGFEPIGGGRAGGRHGYKLLDPTWKQLADLAREGQADYDATKLLDHLRGAQAHFEYLASASSGIAATGHWKTVGALSAAEAAIQSVVN